MKIEVKQEEVPEIKVAGEIDHYVAPSLEKYIFDVLESNINKSIIIDFTDVVYLDSAAIGVLFASLDLIKTKSPGSLILVICPNTNVKKIIDLVGIQTDPDFVLLSNKDQVVEVLDKNNNG